MKSNILFFLCITTFSLYSMQENTSVKDAFQQLDPKQQKFICQSIKQNKPFNVSNDVRSIDAVQIVKMQDDGRRVKVFKDKRNFDVLVDVFTAMCK